MRPRYVIALDVVDRLVVIVGGGAVGARKARGLLESGATRVRVVSPAFDAAMPDGVERVAEAYAPRHLEGAWLVFAATDSPAVNEAVVSEARLRGVWVNRADARGGDLGESSGEGPAAPGSDFSTPARFDVGGATVTVSAGSPAVSAMIRDGLRERMDPGWAVVAEAMAELRPLIRDRLGLTESDRRQLLRAIAGQEAVEVARGGGMQALRKWVMAKVDEAVREVPASLGR